MPESISPSYKRTLINSVILLALAGGVAVAGSLVGSILRPAGEQKIRGGGQPDSSGLVVDRGGLSFGEVWEASDFPWTIAIINTRDTAVTVGRFTSSCSCSEITPTSLVIPPGETRSIAVKLDLRPSQAKDASKPILPFTVDVTPILREGEGERRGPTWELSGRVKRTIQVPRAFELGRHSELAQPLRPAKFVVQTFNGVDDLLVSGPSNIDIKAHRSKDDASRYELTVRQRGQLRTGLVEQELRLTPRHNGHRLPPRMVPVRGRIVEDVVFSPSEVVFGANPVGTDLREVVTLRSLTGSAFEVTDAQATGDGVRVERTAEGYAVHVRVPAVGQADGSVSFRIRRADGTEREVPLNVSYLGIAGGADK